MALSVASLTHGINLTGNPVIGTASVSPGANNLELVVILSNSVIPTNLSLSGNGLTWVPIYTDVNQGSNRAVNIWRALGSSPTAGQLFIVNPSAVSIMFDYLEVSGGVDTSGTNGSGAVRQTATTFGASPLDAGLSVTLATSAIVGMMGGRDNSAVLTPSAGYTALNVFDESGAGTGVLGTEWNSGITTGACGWSFTGPPSASVFGIEVQVSSGPPPPPADTFVAAWGMQAPALNRGRPVMVASGSRPGTQVS